MTKVVFFSMIVFLSFFKASLEGVIMDPAAHKFYSHPEYAKDMGVECYIVNREQLGDFFKSAKSPITQLTNNALLKPNEIYLLVKVTNKGKYIHFGRLNCFVPYVKDPFPIEVQKMFSKKPSSYAFRLDPCVIDADDQKPVITYVWEDLYCL